MKKKTVFIFLFITVIGCNKAIGITHQNITEDWIFFEKSTFPDIPDSLGLSGAFIGTTEGVLVVAGGSNFEKPIWEGGEKKYHDSIYALLNVNGEYAWQNVGKLPNSIAHGAVVETVQGLLFIGGENQDQKFNSVLRLEWDEINQKIVFLMICRPYLNRYPIHLRQF